MNPGIQHSPFGPLMQAITSCHRMITGIRYEPISPSPQELTSLGLTWPTGKGPRLVQRQPAVGLVYGRGVQLLADTADCWSLADTTGVLPSPS